MACGCGCNSCGDSFSGLNGLLGGTLLAGSHIRVGLRVSPDTPNYSIDDIVNTVEGCLYNSGAFNSVSVTLGSAGMFSDAYLLVSAETYFDFGQVEDVGGFIQQELQNCFPQLAVRSRDAVAVDYAPQAGPGNSDAQQVTGPGGQPSPNSKCPAGYIDDSYFWQPVHCVPQVANVPGAPVTPKCPVGYFDNGWFSVNCVPVGTEKVSTSTWVLIGAAAIGGLILVSKAR